MLEPIDDILQYALNTGVAESIDAVFDLPDELLFIEPVKVSVVGEKLGIPRVCAQTLLLAANGTPPLLSKLTKTYEKLLTFPQSNDFDPFSFGYDEVGELDFSSSDDSELTMPREKLSIHRAAGELYRATIIITTPIIAKVENKWKIEPLLIDTAINSLDFSKLGEFDSLTMGCDDNTTVELDLPNRSMPKEEISKLAVYQQPKPIVSSIKEPRLDPLASVNKWELGISAQYDLNWTPFTKQFIWDDENENIEMNEQVEENVHSTPSIDKIQREDKVFHWDKSFMSSLSETFGSTVLKPAEEPYIAEEQIPELLKFSRFFSTSAVDLPTPENEKTIDDVSNSPPAAAAPGTETSESIIVPDLTNTGIIINTTTIAKLAAQLSSTTNATLVEQSLGSYNCDIYYSFTAAAKIFDSSRVNQVVLDGTSLAAREAAGLHAQSLNNLIIYILGVNNMNMDLEILFGKKEQGVIITRLLNENELFLQICKDALTYKGIIPQFIPFEAATDESVQFLCQNLRLNVLNSVVVLSEMTIQEFINLDNTERYNQYHDIISNSTLLFINNSREKEYNPQFLG